MYFYVFIVAIFLATAQTLWKIAGNNYASLAKDFSSLAAILKTAFSPQFIAGAILYVVATAIYVWLFSRYTFFAVQVTLISTSVILAALISYFFFKENPSPINIFGLVVIIVGIVLATQKAGA
jgi:drug/metabolite transporter (DMT)-like permease